jgi:phosphoglycerate dehydrogenase-like enzyme
MGYVLRSERRLELAADQQRAKLWNQEPFTRGTRPVAGLTLGLLGCGDIGW